MDPLVILIDIDHRERINFGLCKIKIDGGGVHFGLCNNINGVLLGIRCSIVIFIKNKSLLLCYFQF